MNNVNSAPARNSPTASLAAPWDFPAGFAQQMAAALDGACAMFSGFENMRKIQLDAAHQALQQHRSAAARLRGPCDAAQLAQIQATLFNSDLEGSLQYWQQLGSAAMEMQSRMLACVNHLVESDTLLEAAAAVESLDKPRRRA